MKKKLLIFSIALTYACHVPAEELKGTYKFKIEVVEQQPTMTMRFKVKADSATLGAEYGRVLPAVYAHVMQNGGKVTGSVFGRFHVITDEHFDVEAGVPVAKTVAPTNEIKASKLPRGRVVTTIHMGDYETLSKAHDALAAWLKQNGHTAKGGPWEVYITDPIAEKDPRKWKTKIVQPIKEQKQHR